MAAKNEDGRTASRVKPALIYRSTNATDPHELLDRTLIWNERHLRHALRQYEQFYNAHRAHQTMMQAAPLRTVPAPITDIARIAHLDIRRRDRLGGVLHEYQHAA